MANILCITTGLTGILNASFEIAKRLEAAGHSCIIASPLDVRKKVETNDFKFVKIRDRNFDPAPPVPGYRGPFRKIKRLANKIGNASNRKEKAIVALGMNDFKEQIKTINPDLILVDIELHEHIMTLKVNHYNFVLLSQWFSTWKRKGLPPIVSDIIPGLNPNGSPTTIAKQWKKIRKQRWWMFTKKRLLSVGTDRRSILKLYANKIGFSKSYISENYWPGPFSYDKLPVISITNEAVEFPHDVRPQLDYVGAMVFEKRKEIEVDTFSLHEIFDRKKKDKSNLVYCSVSTFKKGDTLFLRNVVKAVEGKDNWLLIISMGGQLSTDIFESMPNNVFAYNSLPQLRVLQHADLSINHGGIHTINECIHFKVPMLVYSGKRSDQNGCAARVHHHGLGIMADKDIDNASDIRLKIDHVLNSPSIKSNVEAAFSFNLEYKNEKKLSNIVNGYLTNSKQGIAS